MGESLKDQLVALGLATDGKKKAGKPRRSGGGRKRSGARDLTLDEAYRLRERAEKQSAEARRQRKIEEDRRRREINARLQAIADEHAVNDAQAEVKRNFLYKGRIRSVLVTPEQLRAVNAGELGIVFVRGSYYLLPPEQVEAARAISEEHIPDLGADGGEEEEEFPVPDDLVW